MLFSNPLYLSPVYNEDGSLYIKTTVLFHGILVSVEILLKVYYRVPYDLAEKGGTYFVPYSDVKRSYNLLAEVGYTMQKNKLNIFILVDGVLKLAFGLDDGALRGNNRGFQFTISSGILNFRNENMYIYCP